ncbi:cupin [Catenulispora sp. GP43]|uniref:cupin n=1 Tax=Catenulispora sp. GP43 TaxID=3156263 RepID=UPI003517A701
MPLVRHRLALAGAIAAVTALTPGVAGATAASGVSAIEKGRSTLAGEERVLRQITVQPGGSTGWQWHDGTLAVYVEQGTLTHNESDCGSTEVYSSNSSFVEPGGADNVQIDRNLGTTPLVMDVLYVDPVNSPLSEDAPNPGCRFQ